MHACCWRCMPVGAPATSWGPTTPNHKLRTCHPRPLLLQLEGSTAGLSSALSALTHLALRCRLESAALAPGLLEGLSSLRRLELSSLRIAQFTPRLAQALGRLTHLSCSGARLG